MSKPHKHAELIKQWADGAEIEVHYKSLNKWYVVKDPAWNGDFEFRVKPNRNNNYLERIMSNVKLELSGESMDALFVDLLNDNLALILNPDVKFIHEDDYDNNVTLAHSIMTLMRYQKDTCVFDKWFADVYWPTLNKYTEKYEELTYKEEEQNTKYRIKPKWEKRQEFPLFYETYDCYIPQKIHDFDTIHQFVTEFETDWDNQDHEVLKGTNGFGDTIFVVNECKTSFPSLTAIRMSKQCALKLRKMLNHKEIEL